MAADFDPDAYVQQKKNLAEDPQFAPQSSVTVTGFDPDAYVAQKTEKAPEPEDTGGIKLGNLSDAAVSGERMLNAIAKPPAALAEYLGWSEPAKELMARDQYLKEHSGLGASLSSLGGDIAGLMIPGAGASKVAEATEMLPKATELMEKIPGASKLLENAPDWLEKALGSKYAQASALGGTSSFLSPTGTDITDPNFAKKHAEEAGTAAALGPVFTAGAGAVGRALDPAMKRFKDLLAQGFTKEQIMKDTTLGQIVGGLTQKAENIGAYIPFGGISSAITKGSDSLKNSANDIEDSIAQAAKEKAAQLKMSLENATKGLDTTQKNTVIPEAKADVDAKNADMQARYDKYVADTTANMDERHANEFSRPIIEKAIEPAGVKLPPNIHGTEAIKFAQGVEKQLYDSALPKIGDEFGDVAIGDNEIKSLNEVLDANKRRLDGEGSKLYNKLAGKIDDIKDAAGDAGRLSAYQWHNIFKDLGAEAQNYKGPLSSGTDREYGNAVSQLKNKWMDIIENTPGSDLIKTANQVHSALQVPQTASGYLNTYLEKGGKFDPKDYLRALKSDTSGKRFSAGDANLQDQAYAAYQKMADEKLALKAQHDAFKAQLDASKKANKAQLGSDLRVQNQNIANQKAYLKSQTQAQQDAIKNDASAKKESLGKTMQDVLHSGNDSYAQHRILYGLTGLGGMGVASRFLPLDPSTQLMIGGALLTGSHAYALPAVQSALKHAAVSRPEAVRAVGQAIRENAPKIGGLAAYSNIQSDNTKK